MRTIHDQRRMADLALVGLVLGVLGLLLRGVLDLFRAVALRRQLGRFLGIVNHERQGYACNGAGYITNPPHCTDREVPAPDAMGSDNAQRHP
jgi:hypothetical protein